MKRVTQKLAVPLVSGMLGFRCCCPGCRYCHWGAELAFGCTDGGYSESGHRR